LTSLAGTQLGLGWFAEQAGGLDRYYAGLLGAFDRLGVAYRGLVAGSERVAGMTGGKVCAFAPQDAGLLRRWRRVRRAAVAQPASLIVSHFALYAFPLGRELERRAHVVHFHGPWADEKKAEGDSGAGNWVKRRIEKRVYHSATRLITLSEAFAAVLRERYAVPGERIRVIPGGIDAAAYDTGLSRDEAREALGWPRDRRVVLCVRRLAARMGLEALIDAAGALWEKHPDLLVLIAGKGRLKESLEERIKSKRLTDHVKLLGFVPDEDLPTAYRAAEVSVVPTRALEGFGLVTLESLAAGTPCLVTPVGGLPEAVGGLSRELILAGCESSDIAAGLDRALDDPAALPDAETCRRYVREHFDWSVIAPRVLEVYREAVEGWGKAEGRR